MYTCPFTCSGGKGYISNKEIITQEKDMCVFGEGKGKNMLRKA
jgi:hypothetical protein